MTLTSGAHSSVAQAEKVGWACCWAADAAAREKGREEKLGCGPVTIFFVQTNFLEFQIT